MKPCQDVSTAGKRAGMKDGTRSGLWSEMRRAVEELRPSYVVIENVRGLLSAEGEPPTEEMAALGKRTRNLRNATDLVERKLRRATNEGNDRYAAFHRRDAVRLIRARDRAVATERRERRTLVRAIGKVVGDLADIGYDARWCGLRAADVGAPHGRFRVFILASPADARSEHGQQRRVAAPGQAEGGRALGELAGRDRAPVALLPTTTTRDVKGRNQRDDATCLTGALLPTPRATDGTKGGPNQRGSSGDLMLPSAVQLLPTPVTNDMGEGKTVEAWDEWTARMKSKHGNGNGHGASLAIEAQRLLPTPTTTQRGTDANLDTREGARANLHNVIAGRADQWGDYAPAIARWEAVTRPAPAPTEPTGKNGAPRLSPRFSEWLMGLPDGWITDVPGITRTEALRLCGNGVVTRQSVAALEWLVSVAALDSARSPLIASHRASSTSGRRQHDNQPHQQRGHRNERAVQVQGVRQRMGWFEHVPLPAVSRDVLDGREL